MSNTSDPVECVGSLLVHSSDVQELTEEAALGNKGDAKNTIECVGSLVVPSTEMEELSDSRQMPEVNLKKRVTAVGTLLVPQSDDDDVKDTPQAQEPTKVSSPSLVRRFTDSLQGPPPSDDSSPDTWAD